MILFSYLVIVLDCVGIQIVQGHIRVEFVGVELKEKRTSQINVHFSLDCIMAEEHWKETSPSIPQPASHSCPDR